MSGVRIRPWARGPWGPPYGSIMGELRDHAYSAHKLALRCGQTRPDMSRLLQNLRRAGYVEHNGAWRITEAGRQAIADAESAV